MLDINACYMYNNKMQKNLLYQTSVLAGELAVPCTCNPL